MRDVIKRGKYIELSWNKVEVGRENGRKCKRSAMFQNVQRGSGDHWTMEASFPKHAQILTSSALRQGKYKFYYFFFGPLI